MGSDVLRRIIILSLVMVGAIVFLVPTFFHSTFQERDWISRPLSLGLDLSGGVYLVYRVEAGEAVKSRMQGTANAIRSDLRRASIPVTRARVTERPTVEITLFSQRNLAQAKELIQREFSNLQFVEERAEGERITLVYGMSDREKSNIERTAVDQAVETLRNRVDQFGVAEPLIQKVGNERILLQMPGVQDVEAVKRVVGSVAQLEFRFRPNPDTAPYQIMIRDRDGNSVPVEDEVQMTGEAIDDARPLPSQGRVEVSLNLTGEGARTFRRVTTEGVGRQLSIILDGVEYSAPVIEGPIVGGRASITGRFTMAEAQELAIVLRAGALPAPLTVLEERTVGPTLGRESIERGVTAILVGFGLVIIFMVLYYGLSGMVAVGTLFINVFLVMAVLSAFGATLTLPGLAGLALTIGMAVDANVIIFERIREELRNGSSRDAAVSAGFGKALSAIVDANITTLLAGLILYYFGTGPIRGFAVTLSVGIFTTLFCATFVARLAFDAFRLEGRKGLSI